MSSLPSPVILGMPDKFQQWRNGQAEAITQAIDTDRRFSMLVLPTGSGKSLSYMTVSRLKGLRTLILTSTKGLQTQLMNDFSIADLRGKSAYSCLVDKQWSCEDGPCNFGWDCDYRERECLYYAAIRKAKQSHIVSTNYAMWMALREREEEPLGRFAFLVLDEAHDAPDWICNHLGVEFDDAEWRRLGDRIADVGLPTGGVQEWRMWAGRMLGAVETEINELRQEVKETHSGQAIREAKRLSYLQLKLKAVLRAQPDWVIEINAEKHTRRIDPVWPKEYAEVVLFRMIPHVYMTSATASPKTAELLGVEAPQLMLLEQQSSFPVANRPVYYVPTERVDHRMTQQQEKMWLLRIEQIVAGRLDRKGIIHSVSYKRRDTIAEMLQKKFGTQLAVYTHSPHNAGKVVAAFKSHPGNRAAVLVSPSVSTGFDFPDDLARYQIISKLAFPDARNAVMRARTQQDKEFVYYLAMQDLVQAAGRSTRSPEDWSEVFIVDDHFSWLWRNYKKFAPKWFQQAVRWERTIPKTMERRQTE